jgi:hypothetical protein
VFPNSAAACRGVVPCVADVYRRTGVEQRHDRLYVPNAGSRVERVQHAIDVEAVVLACDPIVLERQRQRPCAAHLHVLGKVDARQILDVHLARGAVPDRRGHRLLPEQRPAQEHPREILDLGIQDVRLRGGVEPAKTAAVGADHVPADVVFHAGADQGPGMGPDIQVPSERTEPEHQAGLLADAGRRRRYESQCAARGALDPLDLPRPILFRNVNGLVHVRPPWL